MRFRVERSARGSATLWIVETDRKIGGRLLFCTATRLSIASRRKILIKLSAEQKQRSQLWHNRKNVARFLFCNCPTFVEDSCDSIVFSRSFGAIIRASDGRQIDAVLQSRAALIPLFIIELLGPPPASSSAALSRGINVTVLISINMARAHAANNLERNNRRVHGAIIIAQFIFNRIIVFVCGITEGQLFISRNRGEERLDALCSGLSASLESEINVDLV